MKELIHWIQIDTKPSSIKDIEHIELQLNELCMNKSIIRMTDIDKKRELIYLDTFNESKINWYKLS